VKKLNIFMPDGFDTSGQKGGGYLRLEGVKERLIPVEQLGIV